EALSEKRCEVAKGTRRSRTPGARRQHPPPSQELTMSWFTKKAPARPVAPSPGGDRPLNIKGFDCLLPDPQYGATRGDWNNDRAEYAYIPAEGNLPFVDLAAKFVELIRHCWQLGQARPNAARGPVKIGMNAAPTVPMPYAKTPASQLGTGARAA